MQKEDSWPQDQVDLLLAWWPHFGSEYIANLLGRSSAEIRRKAKVRGLHRLPRAARLCVRCRTAFQAGGAGLLCHDCRALRRKEIRRAQPRTLEQWISEAVNVARYRSPHPCDLTTEYMVDLWYRQDGRCYYSGRQLVPPKYKRGREPFSASIDRLVPAQGYVQGNVVWAAWCCNAGKNALSVAEYVQLCAEVVRHSWTPVARWIFICGLQCPLVEK
jgi:hypothetical protein